MNRVANVLLDESGHIRSWNARARNVWGFDDPVVVGRHCSCLYGAQAGSLPGLLARALADGEAAFDEPCVHRDGTRVPAQTLVTVESRDGRVHGYSLVVRTVGASAHGRPLDDDPLYGIIQSAMDAIIVVDEDQKIVIFNAAAEAMFGVPAALCAGVSLDRFIPQRFRAAHREHVVRFGRTGITTRRMGAHRPLFGLRSNGEEFPIDASISQIRVGEARLYTVILRDVTERANIETKVREERDVAQRYLDVAGVMLVALDANGIVTLINRKGCDILGYAESEIVGRNWFDHFVPANHRVGTRKVFAGLMGGDPVSGAMHENPVLARDGSERVIDWRNQLLTDKSGHIIGTLSSGEDITDRKTAQHALERSYRELRELSQVMNEVREAERTRIARELHDELAQWLTALKMDVAWLSARLAPGQENLLTRTERMRGVVDATVASVRRIAADLRPVMLDDLGLVPSIENLLQALAERANLDVKLDVPADGLDFRDPLATAVYRMAQEALTNVARHAQATEVRVTLAREEDTLVIRIVDNGRGIEEPVPGRKSYGVLGIRERAQTLGGEARIYSPAEGGTVVEILIPLARFSGAEAAA